MEFEDFPNYIPKNNIAIGIEETEVNCVSNLHPLQALEILHI